MRNIWTSSALRIITSTGWLRSIGSWGRRRDWSNYCRIGVPYNLLRHLSMAGGSALPNPRLAMPVFVIPPECYA